MHRVGFADCAINGDVLRILPVDPDLAFRSIQTREEATGMKRLSSKIRDEIARLQEQLRQAETREAERIGRIALKAGLGEIDIEDGELLARFEELAGRFRHGNEKPSKKPEDGAGRSDRPSAAKVTAVPAAGGGGEA
ncbi:conjugal transfer protein TraC [Aminobacter sp. BA135]|uniref:conjugal transfer protein TraC n=1 Tax=Aminobacter sp. BA135 TaxID=537596 RepID=UPI003D7B220C